MAELLRVPAQDLCRNICGPRWGHCRCLQGQLQLLRGLTPSERSVTGIRPSLASFYRSQRSIIIHQKPQSTVWGPCGCKVSSDSSHASSASVTRKAIRESAVRSLFQALNHEGAPGLVTRAPLAHGLEAAATASSIPTTATSPRSLEEMTVLEGIELTPSGGEACLSQHLQ